MEEIIYDTSYLIDLYKKGTRKLTGFTTILNIVEFPKALEFSDLKIIYPTKEDYLTAIRIMKDLMVKGKPIPAIDAIISAIALNRKMTIKTKDEHFLLIKEIKHELKVAIKK